MSRNAKINTLLLLLVAALAVIPLAFGLGDHKEEPFAGADGEAETAITEIDPDYEPWFSPLYEPPSGEVESALFAVQAALGAGVLAYYFGLRRGRRQGEARARERVGVRAPEGAREQAAGLRAPDGVHERDGLPAPDTAHERGDVPAPDTAHERGGAEDTGDAEVRSGADGGRD
ncbi:hypothetical protein GCM10018771_43530 [Streptomyces cellulosae]|nr:hypothetical protein GCM10018771_43530 [Streptomyces cellulosae]